MHKSKTNAFEPSLMNSVNQDLCSSETIKQQIIFCWETWNDLLTLIWSGEFFDEEFPWFLRTDYMRIPSSQEVVCVSGRSRRICYQIWIFAKLPTNVLFYHNGFRVKKQNCIVKQVSCLVKQIDKTEKLYCEAWKLYRQIGKMNVKNKTIDGKIEKHMVKQKKHMGKRKNRTVK